MSQLEKEGSEKRKIRESSMAELCKLNDKEAIETPKIMLSSHIQLKKVYSRTIYDFDKVLRFSFVHFFQTDLT